MTTKGTNARIALQNVVCRLLSLAYTRTSDVSNRFIYLPLKLYVKYTCHATCPGYNIIMQLLQLPLKDFRNRLFCFYALYANYAVYE